MGCRQCERGGRVKKAQDETAKMSIVRCNAQKNGLLAACHRQMEDKEGGVTMSHLCPNCNSFPLEDNVGLVFGRNTTKWWCAICGEKYDWRQPNRLLVVQIGESLSRPRYSKRVRGITVGDVLRRLIARTIAKQVCSGVESPLLFNSRCPRQRVANGLRTSSKVCTDINAETTVVNVDGVGAFDLIFAQQHAPRSSHSGGR